LEKCLSSDKNDVDKKNLELDAPAAEDHLSAADGGP